MMHQEIETECSHDNLEQIFIRSHNFETNTIEGETILFCNDCNNYLDTKGEVW